MSIVQPDPITRRKLLKGAAGATTLAFSGTLGRSNFFYAEQPAARPNVIQQENALEGATDWQLTRVRVDRSDGCRSMAIEGYCSKQSVAAGEKLQIMVSTEPAEKFHIEIFRTGYYGGRGARRMSSLGPFEGKRQRMPCPTSGPCTSVAGNLRPS